jgi:hypothetical protein
LLKNLSIKLRAVRRGDRGALNRQRLVVAPPMRLNYFRFRWHSRHDRIRCWLRPVANDPKQSFLVHATLMPDKVLLEWMLVRDIALHNNRGVPSCLTNPYKASIAAI